MINFDIYEGKTEKNRKKTFLVFDFKTTTNSEARKAARIYFKCADKHVKTCLAWTEQGELWLLNPKGKPDKAKTVRVAYWV